MSSKSSSSEQSNFNFAHSPIGPLSPRESSECDNSLEFSHFNYLLPLNNAASDPTLHEENQIFLGYGEELIPMPLDKEMLDKSMSSDVEGALSSSISSGDSSQYGSEKELDTDEPFWEFIDKPKYPPKEEESEEVDGGEEEESEQEEEDEEN